MLIDPPPSHQAGRYLLALLVVTAFVAVIAGALLSGLDTALVEGAKGYIAEVRGAWKN